MDAIVYVTNTGYTAEYAELLSKETGLPCYSAEQAKLTVTKGSEIIFLGWICAGLIKGWKKARKLYSVRGIAGVGMGSYSEKTVNDLIRQNRTGEIPTFYCQGGFDFDRLKGINKFAMKLMQKCLNLSRKAEVTEEEKMMNDMMQSGANLVSLDKIQPVIDWYKSSN